MAAVHDGPFFTGTVIKGLAIRSSSNEFNLLELGHSQDILYSNNTVTRIRGDGLLEHHGESKLFGQMTISSPQRNQNALLSLSYNEKLASANLESTTMVSDHCISSMLTHFFLD